MKSRFLLTLALFCLFTGSFAQKKPKSDSTKTDSIRVFGPLFDGEDMVELKIAAMLREVLRDRGEKTAYHPALLTQVTPAGPVEIPIKMKVRGNFRRQTSNCAFPPLLLNLPEKKIRKTLFEGQNKLKLVTHCQNEEYILREYLIYKMYNLLSEYSFRARLARVTYEDSAKRRAPEVKYAFLLEEEESVAQRNHSKNSTQKRLNMAYTDSLTMARVAVFEYFIGNTDWSVPYLHNIKLLTSPTHALPLPVAYDFDHAGIVDAKYAFPAEQLNITSVRDRLYRGYSYPVELFQKVFDQFNTLKPKFYALYETNTRLDPAYVKKTIKYLDQFYEVINKPSAVKTEFIERGDKNSPTSRVVIKGMGN